jgi:uncharacterized protein (DUF427 family)
MAKASWQGAVIAEGDDVVVVEGNVYFAPAALKREHLRASTKRTTCSWKGECGYFDVVVGEQVNADAAWCYEDRKLEALHVKGRVAFWKGVTVER